MIIDYIRSFYIVPANLLYNTTLEVDYCFYGIKFSGDKTMETFFDFKVSGLVF